MLKHELQSFSTNSRERGGCKQTQKLFYFQRTSNEKKKQQKKPTKRIITSPLAIENSLAESEVFGRGLRTMK